MIGKNEALLQGIVCSFPITSDWKDETAIVLDNVALPCVSPF